MFILYLFIYFCCDTRNSLVTGLSSSIQLGVLPGASTITSILLAPSATYVVPSTSAPVSVALSQLLDSQFGSAPLMPLNPLGLLTPSANKGLSLALAVEPVPAKLVGRITSGQFMEMRDLLGDNITLTQQIEEVRNTCTFPSYILPVCSHPRLREISSLPSWIYCFFSMRIGWNYGPSGSRSPYLC